VRAGDLIGRYRVLRLLGSGAFASVWLAEDETLNVQVAIKVLADNWSHDLNVRERFVEEARILWTADHDAVVRVLAYDELPSGQPYLVMQYADEGSLADRLELRRTVGGPFTVEESLAVAIAICRCLHVVHQLGFVHRDIKPSNLLFRSRPEHSPGNADQRVLNGVQLVLGDLGLAKSLAHASGITISTGTPQYMAPELGMPGEPIDGRADLYAVGVTMYEMLVGHAPHQVDSIVAVRNLGAAPLPKPIQVARPDVPVELANVITRSMALKADERFESADALADALQPFLADRTTTTTTTTTAAAIAAPTVERSGKPLAPPSGSTPESTAPTTPEIAEVVGPGTTEAAPGKLPRRRRRGLAVAAALIATAGGTAIWLATRDSNPVERIIVDRTGALQITTPGSWSDINAVEWTSDLPELGGFRIAAIDASTDQAARRRLTAPGVFVAASSALAWNYTPQSLLDHYRRAEYGDCTGGSEQPRTIGGHAGVTAQWVCRGVFVTETMLASPDARYLVRIQLVEPPDSDRAANARVVESLVVVKPPE
jgi:eukaryotic-like serine/threonine-protein kinase